MNKKSSNFFEEHIEKIVLAIVGLVCLWLFVTRVIFSSSYVEYDNGKFGPDAIDSYISKQAEVLENKLNREPEPKEQPYEPKVDDFSAMLDSTVNDVDTSRALPQPIMSSKSRSDDRVYHPPSIGEVREVAVEHIRAVAYVPNIEINEKNVYSAGNSEPNDIDFVTVEAKFDVSELYKRFYESFAGEQVKPSWRDPCLAQPIFAAVQLQKQELLPNGSWSDWQVVPRSKVESRKEMFRIIENINALPAGGMKVRLLQFDNIEVKMDLLQPEAYQIASAKEEWFPPSLHKEYVKYRKEIDIQQKREAAAERREERSSRPRETRTLGTMGLGEEIPTTLGRGTARRTPTTSRTDRRDVKEQPHREILQTLGDIAQRFNKISITVETNFARMNEPLLFWAHDDTVEPGKSYRYKIRLGVFNPIAGTNQFYKQDESMKNKVILWSEASNVTEIVDIPKTLYFFPREIQETAKAVTVQVSRYILGYWYSKDFTVKRGELIGNISDYKPTEEEESSAVTIPKTVDYTTGAVLVDVIPVNDWAGGGNLHARHFFDMLYSFDGESIKRSPIKTRYWNDDLQNKFSEIRRAEKELKEPLKSWGSGPARPGRPTAPGMEGMPPGFFPGMMTP